jgi:hypothetical protein
MAILTLFTGATHSSQKQLRLNGALQWQITPLALCVAVIAGPPIKDSAGFANTKIILHKGALSDFRDTGNWRKKHNIKIIARLRAGCGYYLLQHLRFKGERPSCPKRRRAYCS